MSQTLLRNTPKSPSNELFFGNYLADEFMRAVGDGNLAARLEELEKTLKSTNE
jgi:hypothetical protein